MVERDSQSQIVRELSYTEPQDGNNVEADAWSPATSSRRNAPLRTTWRGTRDRQEELMADDRLGWRDNKTDIANRNWTQYPLALAEHGANGGAGHGGPRAGHGQLSHL